MSLVDLYALESKFTQVKKEYMDIMQTLNYSCVGEYKSTSSCQKASELNAQMQTYLIQISNLLVIINPDSKRCPTVNKQQAHLLALADSLENDKNALTTTKALKTDMALFADMNHSHTIAWAFVSVLVFGIIVHQMKKI